VVSYFPSLGGDGLVPLRKYKLTNVGVNAFSVCFREVIGFIQFPLRFQIDLFPLAHRWFFVFGKVVEMA